MMQTTLVFLASTEMYSTTECAAALAKPVVGSSRKSTSGSGSRGEVDESKSALTQRIEIVFIQ